MKPVCLWLTGGGKAGFLGSVPNQGHDMGWKITGILDLEGTGSGTE